MSRSWEHARVVVLAVVVSGWSVGCGPTIELEEGSESGNADSTTTTPPPPSTTTMPPGTTTAPPSTTDIPQPGDTTADSEESGVGFVPLPDVLGPGCDVLAQDCPRGYKCMPWSNDGSGSWNDTRCWVVGNDPDAVGEPCTVEGNPASGVDTCDFGSMCWHVDPDTLEGTCVAFCVGDYENPSCEDPNASCKISSDGPLALCLFDCDPVGQDCGVGEGCYPSNDVFACAPDASGDMGAAGQACEFVNVCDPGSFCASASTVPDCPGNVGCCSPFCDLGDLMPPCLPGQQCLPWYENGTAPPGYETVGACLLPR